MNIKVVKIVSMGLAVAGAVINVVANALGDRLLDDKIETKIAEALTKKN